MPIQLNRALKLLGALDSSLLDTHSYQPEVRLDEERVAYFLDEFREDVRMRLYIASSGQNDVLGAMQTRRAYRTALGVRVNDIEIDYIVVDPERRNSGIGTEMLKTAEAQARRVGAHGLRLFSVAEAVGFYTKNGFTHDQTHPHSQRGTMVKAVNDSLQAHVLSV